MRILAPLLFIAVLCAAKVKARDGSFHVSAFPQARQRAAYRDSDWKRLRKLLVSEVVPESEKREWTTEFLVAYWRSPGVTPVMAKALLPYVPPCKMREALRALAQGKKLKADASRDLPGFYSVGAAEPNPEAPDPLEALLVSKAKEYDAARAAIQQKQLALLQGTSRDSSVDTAQVRRGLAQVLPPLQKELCELSGRYADKFGPLALKGLLARENLLEPFDAARCP